MKITETEVRYVADLANLSLTEDEVRRFQADLDEILAHVERLSDIDTSGVEPMTQILYPAGETESWRDDQQIPPLGTEIALANAPQAGGGHFKVPKVIER